VSYDDDLFTESDEVEEDDDPYDGKYPRKYLRPGRLYYEQPTGMYFYTPDGEGCIWYDTYEEALDDVGDSSGVITICQELSDF
jgi:hypothetical protein